MKRKELNILVGFNLRRLRFDHELTQEQLAERIGVNTRTVQRWETGKKGIGKKVLLKLCLLFRVEPQVFYEDERAQNQTRSREISILSRLREAEKLGVAEQIELFCDFIIGQAKIKQCLAGKGRPIAKGNSYLRQMEEISSSMQSWSRECGDTRKRIQ